MCINAAIFSHNICGALSKDKVQTYKWARMYMKQVGLTVLLQFQRSCLLLHLL